MTSRITIAGGFYREKCRFPPIDDFWGSGGRAAAAIAELGISVNFVTAADSRAERVLATIAQAIGFKFIVARIAETIAFRYDHGLSTPSIWPPLQTVPPTQLTAADDCVLQFGMLEADVDVVAQTVIYDPQQPFSPRHFRAAHKPARLAYVLNSVEARRLGANDDIDEAIKKIAADSGAGVVVVKRGPFGATVFEDGRTTAVPAFETHTVGPIGSGDVFAAVFAAQWGVKGLAPVDAAEAASRATAEYVENRVLPIHRSVIETPSNRPALRLTHRPLSADEYDVYLAGPFFNMHQLWLVDEIRLALQGMGLKVFSPYHDVGVGRSEDVAPKDIEALERSCAVFAVLDGLDTGTVFEIGFARARSKPVIAFTQSTPEEPLKMIAGTDCKVVHDFVSAIYHVAWAAWR